MFNIKIHCGDHEYLRLNSPQLHKGGSMAVWRSVLLPSSEKVLCMFSSGTLTSCLKDIHVRLISLPFLYLQIIDQGVKCMPNEEKKNHTYVKAVDAVAFHCFSLDKSGGRTTQQTSTGSLEPLIWLNLPSVHQIN